MLVHMPLFYRNQTFRFGAAPLALILGILSSCGMFGPGADAGNLADTFYECQKTGESFAELFADNTIAAQAGEVLDRRTRDYGRYESHRRIGSNRHMVLDGASRRESVTFVFEVNSEHGNTRETLKISRTNAAESFHITAYIVEDAGRRPDPSPPGTSST